MKGQWLQIGGASPRGFGLGSIEARVATGNGDGWKWMTIPKERLASLIELLNQNPKYRDALLSFPEIDDDEGGC